MSRRHETPWTGIGGYGNEPSSSFTPTVCGTRQGKSIANSGRDPDANCVCSTALTNLPTADSTDCEAGVVAHAFALALLLGAPGTATWSFDAAFSVAVLAKGF